MNRQDIQVTVDIVVFTVHEHKLRVLLIQRVFPLHRSVRIAGGIFLPGETLDAAASSS